MAFVFRVTGRVQGVSFRAFVQWQARSREIVGWVRNRSDGSVEGIAGGAQEDLQEFLVALGEGPPNARVADVAVWEDERADLPATFEIRPTC